jgi:hypothetical protein
MPIAIVDGRFAPADGSAVGPAGKRSLISGGVDQRRALELALSTRQARFSTAATPLA